MSGYTQTSRDLIQEQMLRNVAIAFGVLAVTLLMGYYVFEVLPAIDGVRMYELEQEAGMLPDY